MSKNTKRVIWGGVGLLFAVVYGFWTMLGTGGGHGNFIWFMLFLFVEFFGLYFPLMAILAVDLKRRFIKVLFGSLIIFNLIASFVMIAGWVMEPPRDPPSDFSRMMQGSGVAGILTFAIAHFLPTLFFAALLIKAIIDKDVPTDDRVLCINLLD